MTKRRFLSFLTALMFMAGEILPVYAAPAADDAVVTEENTTAEEETELEAVEVPIVGDEEDPEPSVADDPDWYKDYYYTLEGDEIHLHQYISDSTVEEVFGTAVIDGKTYSTVLDPVKNEYSMWYDPNGNYYTNLSYLRICSGVKTTEDASYLFAECYTLTTLNVSGLDTSAAVKTDYMFKNNQNLSSLDVSMLDLSNVTSMKGMFSQLYMMHYFKLGDPDTSKVTDMNSLFGLSFVEDLDISVLETSNVTDMGGMFEGCSSLTKLDLSTLDTKKVTDMSRMFAGCSSLTGLDVSFLDTSKVTDMSGMFTGCRALTTLDLSKLNTSAVENMSEMFFGDESLTAVDLGKMDTSKVKDMSTMFCMTGLESVDVSMFDTSSVTDMSNMFNGCRQLIALDLKNFNTSSVTDMSRMFEMTWHLKKLDISSFDTSSVVNMNNMFFGASDLESLDVSSFDTSNVTDMGGMFYSCGYYTSDFTFDVSNFDTSKVTNMESMFRGISSKQLDLSKLDTSSVTDFSAMFYESKNLERLDLSTFNTSKCRKFSHMFYDCWSLKYINLGNIDVSAADSADGLAMMFHGCAALAEIDVSMMDVSYVSNIAEMFSGCVSMKYLNLLKWNMKDDVWAGGIIADSAIEELYLPVKAFAKTDLTECDHPEREDLNVLKKVYYAGTQAQWDALDNKVTEGVEVICDYEGEGPQPSPYDPEGKEVRGVSIQAADELTLAVGDKRTFTAYVEPETAWNKMVKWKSSDPSIVSVTPSAQYEGSADIKALSAGTAVITVITDDGGYKDNCVITVVAPVAKVTLDKSSIKLPVGGQAELKAAAYTANGALIQDAELTWSSTDYNVVEVDQNGCITALSKGKADISVSSVGDKPVQAKCTVTVGDAAGSVSLKSKTGATSLEAGKTLQLTATVEPAGAVYEKMVFESSDPAVAVVSSKGLVTGISEGDVTISVVIDDSEESSASILLKVTAAAKAKAVSSIEIRKGKLVLKHNEELEAGHADLEGAGCEVKKTISLAAYGSDGKKLGKNDVVFSGSDDEKVSVSPTGKLKLLADTKGEPVTVTVTSLADPAVKACFTIAVRVPVKKISLGAKTVNVNKGECGVLGVSFGKDDPTDKRISFSAGEGVKLALLHEGESIDSLSDEDFTTAAVTADIGAGESLAYLAVTPSKGITIKAQSCDGGKKAQCKLIVHGEVTSLELKTTKVITGGNGVYEATLAAGKSLSPKPVIACEYGADKSLSWSSSNDSIVTVNAKGKIKAVKGAASGSQAVITAVTADGNHSVELTITIK